MGQRRRFSVEYQREACVRVRAWKRTIPRSIGNSRITEWPPGDCSGNELGLRPLWRPLQVWKKSFKPEDWFLQQLPGSTRDDQESR
jgi:hypothetical protein